MEDTGNMQGDHQAEPSVRDNSAAIAEIGNQEFEEKELCQQLSDTLSLSTLTHTLTPIPSLTDRTISISTNTYELPRKYTEECEENLDENCTIEHVQKENWTTPSFHTSTDEMISSSVFDYDTEGSLGKAVESLSNLSISSAEKDDGYKWHIPTWHDIPTPHLSEENEPTSVPHTRRQKNTVESSSDDEPKKLKRMAPVNFELREPSENSYPHSSNYTWSERDFDDFSSISSDAEDLEENDDEPSESEDPSWTIRAHSGSSESEAAVCSTISLDPSITPQLLDAPNDEFDKYIEHNMIATRYGLPYDIVHCACSAEAQLKRDRNVGIKLCKSGSCTNFEEKYGELDGRAIRLWHTSKRLMGYKRACRIYRTYMNKPDIAKEREFITADYKLKVGYPNYWIHLNEKYVAILTEEDADRENHSRVHMIRACQRVLRAQDFFSQHYQVEMRDYGRDVKFSCDFVRIRADFKLASEFLMKEYPSLFEYMIEKYNFQALAKKRLLLHENRLRFIEYSKLTKKLLENLEERYYQESLAKIKKRNTV